jgi:FKBP-type peptidyl-prolyl cis-trans isomerase SlyD
MNNGNLKIKDNMVVSLAYVLQLDNGEIVDRADATQPLQYLQGYANIISGLEKELKGLTVGDEKVVDVSPAEGYGERSAEHVVHVPRYVLPTDAELIEGELVELGDRRTGITSMAKVLRVEPNAVMLDLNHPLAGETLHFCVQVVDVREATPEELSLGYVESRAYAYA